MRQDAAVAPAGIADIARAVPFNPSPWLRHRHVQSVMTSLPLRWPTPARRSRQLLQASRELLLDCGDDVRLLALQATQRSIGRDASRGLLVLLHGWEGSANSQYLLSLGQAALDAGFDVARLNLRDHGPTHHLNRGIFHSCLIDEVVGAIRRLQQLHPASDISLAGFSLGGNFALRVGARAGRSDLRLHRIIAVCPVLEPATTLAALEQGPALYREYFLLKWRRSLRRKQAAWPGVYDFRDLLRERSLTGMTARMVAAYTGFPDLQAYLAGYAVTGEALATLETETILITALDDPMILPADLRRLKPVPSLSIEVTGRGGHCGFVESIFGPAWLDRRILHHLC